MNRIARFLFFFTLLVGCSGGSWLNAQAPPWWQTTSIYQIYPRSFQDSDGDGIGDLAGIISRLDYLKNLGVETLWISPFYASPQRDFGYDISDYRSIDPVYGDLQLTDSLIHEVHARGMKVIFDMVLNHTSDQHPWFLESKSSRDNPKADWYVWADGQGDKPGKKPPNNWINVFNHDAWHYVPERDQWYYTAFLDFQPDLNWRNPEVQEAMLDNMRFWLKRGVDGFRLDIFNCILEEKDLTDNPFAFAPFPTRDGMKAKFQVKRHNINHPENYEIATHVRATIDEFSDPERFVIGEVFGPMQTLKGYVGGKPAGLNHVFLFDMIFYKFTAKHFRKMLSEFDEEFPNPDMPTLVYGNHDNFRTMRRVDDDLRKAKLLAMIQLTARGVPVMYYGEEIGMKNAEINKKDALDPISHEFNGIPQFLRNLLPVPLNRDMCRTPMQWEDSENAGFCEEDVTPWLPVSGETELRSVAQQVGDTNSLYSVYQRLLALRGEYPHLREGILEMLDGLPRDVLGFERYVKLGYGKNHEGVIMAFANFSEDRVSFRVPNNHFMRERHIGDPYAEILYCGNHSGINWEGLDPRFDRGTIELGPMEGMVIWQNGYIGL